VAPRPEEGEPRPPRTVTLRTLEASVGAPASVVLRTLVSMGNEVERRSRLERVVAVERRTFSGRRYLTTEVLELEPTAIRSHWLTGPVGAVEESIECVQVAVDRSELTWRGSFEWRDGLRGRLASIAVRWALQRDRRRVLTGARRIAEARFALNRANAIRRSGHPAGSGLLGVLSRDLEVVRSSEGASPDEPIA
jgi:hypothetical protein